MDSNHLGDPDVRVFPALKGVWPWKDSGSTPDRSDFFCFCQFGDRQIRESAATRMDRLQHTRRPLQRRYQCLGDTLLDELAVSF